MRLIVGLGNPGIEYAWTPHNLGFLVVDKLAEQAGIRVTRPEAKSLVGRGHLAGHEVVLAKPQTMMNLSGLAVRELVGRAEMRALRRDRGLRRLRASLGHDSRARARLGGRPQRIEVRDRRAGYDGISTRPAGRAARGIPAAI